MTVAVFPHPDSPTIPSDRPACSSKETRSTAWTTPVGRKNPLVRSRTERTTGTGSSVKADDRSRRSVDAATGRQSHLATSSRYDEVTFVRNNQLTEKSILTLRTFRR